MKYKKIIMLAILLVALLTVSAVNAADNATDDVVIEETTDEVASIEENNVRTFTDLANEIANATDEFNLTRDYAYINDDSSYIDGITIDKKIVINGNGHTINANNQARAFYITTSNVTINNIDFVKCSHNDGGAIKWYQGAFYRTTYNGTLANCSFTNCSAIYYGGAVSGANVINNCSFVNCSVSGHYNEYNDIEDGFGGAVCWTRDNGILANCSFTNCSANEGGAVYWGYIIYHPKYFDEYAYYEYDAYIDRYGEYGTLSNCSFMNCSANEGGAVYWNGDNGVLANCSFMNCSANYAGGAVYWGYEYEFDVDIYLVGNYGNVSYCSFVNCTATDCAAGIYFYGINCRLISPYFEGNVASYSPNWYGVNPVKSLIPTTIRASDVSLAYGDPEELIATLTDFNNKPLAEKPISIRLNNAYHNLVTNSKGEASLSIPTDLAPNTYTATIFWYGDQSYEASSTTAMVVVTNVGVGSFTDLANKIANAEGEVNLTRDYKYLPDKDSSYTDGIIIDKSITINGNGHTINANNQARAFNITTSNVTLNNIDFMECSHNDGGAVYLMGSDGILTNCNFINCSASSSDGSSNGGAVSWSYHAANGILTDCNFINCTVSSSGNYYISSCGGAVAWEGEKGILTNCNFINCSVISTSTYSDSSLYSSSSEYLLGDGNYDPYYSSSYGGAVYWSGSDGILANCSFVNCSAHSYSSIYSYDFSDSYSHGGAVYWSGPDGSLTNCNFINCSASSSSSLRYNINSIYSYGGAVEWTGVRCVIANCIFMDCSVSSTSGSRYKYGDAVSWSALHGVLTNCSFINSHAEIFEGIYFYGAYCSLIDSTFNGHTSFEDYCRIEYYYYPLNVIISTAITASDVSVAYGDSAKLIATLTDFNNKPLAEQTLTIVLNNVEYALNTSCEGEVSLSIPTDLAPNTYTATISYAGNGTYAPSSTTANVVNKMNANITAEYNKESAELIATLTNAKTGKAISGANIVINVNGADTTLKTNSKGQVNFSTADLPSSTSKATVSYKGNSKYNPATTIVYIGTKTNIIISAVYDAENNELMTTLKNEATGKAVANTNVQINTKGEITTVKTNSKGQAILSTAGLPLGTYNATISYAGNTKYNPANTSIEIAVKTKVIVTDVYAYSDRIVAKLTNGATGKFIANANMIIEINGKKYNAKSDNKGQLTFNTDGLELPSAYDLTISYRGNDRYTASNATVAVDLNKANMNIKYTYNAETKQLTATLKNSKTGKTVSNANMVIDLNGVKTIYKSNKQGKIILPTADFTPGTHVGTITYGGNAKYNSISAAFKVDV